MNIWVVSYISYCGPSMRNTHCIDSRAHVPVFPGNNAIGGNRLCPFARKS